MNLTRRGFLSLFGSMTAAAVALPLVDLDKLLWVPGAKRIFVPAGHTFMTTDLMMKEALRTLENNLTFAKSINREYDLAYALKAGDVITIDGKFAFDPRTRKPTKRLRRFVVTDTTTSGIVNLRPGGRA